MKNMDISILIIHKIWRQPNLKDINIKLKHNRLLKIIRKHKWKLYARREMLSPRKIAYLEKNTEKINKEIKKHIKTNKFVSKDIEAKVEKDIIASGVLDASNLDIEEMKMDILFWHFAYGFSINEYLCYGFSHKSADERKLFFSDRESVSFGYDMNDIDDMMIFGDKMNTYYRYQNYFGREAISIDSDEDYNDFVKFTKKYPCFVKKNVRKSCGQSVEVIDIKQTHKTSRELFKDLLSEGKTILEELVIQSPKTGMFNKSSVNTIRCITFNTKEGVMIPYCFMKIGRDGSFIDNGAAGGILVGIDPATGILGTDGVDEIGRRYQRHPDSEVIFKGYQLPEWTKMINICKKMASELLSVPWIGWDMAYTDKGWIVIEGNSLTEVIGPQSTWLKGIKKEIMEFYKMV